MRTKEIIATVAITGAVATFALLNINSVQNGKTFMATPITEAEREFINFVSEHRRSYGTKEEYEYRLALFTKAFQTIKEHNAEKSTFTMGVNQFSDMSAYEYKQLLGYKANMKKSSGAPHIALESDILAAPASVDWVTSGKVTPVKNQGSCGSCWAFSTTGSVEGAYAIKKGSLLSFSEQQLVDCSFGAPYGNLGCNGGLMDSAFQYVEANSLELEGDYPYTGKRATCAASSAKGKTKLTSFKDVKANSISDLLTAVALGPVSIAIEADKAVF